MTLHLAVPKLADLPPAERRVVLALLEIGKRRALRRKLAAA